MDETYRMLGRERQAEFEREAAKWRRAASVARSRSDRSGSPSDKRRPVGPLAGMRVLARAARAVMLAAR
jgi:hypothetical protein